MTKEELEKQDIRLNKLCFDYQEKEKRIAELENKIADIKANCDLAIEGREVKIKELEEDNERLKGDLELWESGGCRAINLFECGVVKELKEQIEKMKCCGNCRFSESDTLNGTFCHREGCFVVASAKCKLWEM